MGKSITNKEQQVKYMKQRLNMFLEVLDAIEPENTELEDIDRLIAMVDELDDKMQQFKARPSEEE
ncbi:SE1561 family protein [Planococcus shenhongbingii]|uniref:SE1561 family protein n=1 Tax=Planococcus shenhongbingii TaxID=3058398 RepID=A0ABT8NHY6_9BACL|nr:SE1561 family protein [Planococcus sp. N017]MDN7247446.1 SE1561 family protein [Planococcus sp. N017]